MAVYTPTDEERQMFKEASQKPVIEWIKTKIDPSRVDEFLRAIDEAEKKLAVK
jgi:hypothetical protein